MTIFSSTSYWNRPLPAPTTTPLTDRDSAKFIKWLKTECSTQYLSLAVGDWALPVYRATAADPLVTIDPTGGGPTVRFRLPAAATAMSGNDAALEVIDPTTNQDVALFEFGRTSSGKPFATGVARYWLDSEGLDERVGGTSGNTGHRGVPGLTMCVRAEDLAGLTHRVKIAIPGTGEWGCFPLSGYEKDKGGIIGEGIVLRVKSQVDLVARGLTGPALAIARGLQTHGAVVGDNSGGTAVLKVERGVTGLARSALAALSWDDYEFAPRGWRP